MTSAQPAQSQEGGPMPLDGNRNLGPVLLAVNWSVFGPSWIIVVFRMISRIWISRNFGWDDAMMLFTQLVNTCGMAFIMFEVHWGLGRHKYFFEHQHYVQFLKYNYLDWIQVFITLALAKIAVCLFLLRISKFDRYRYFLYGVMAFLVLSHVPLTIAYIFQCLPVHKVWKSDAPGSCMSKYAIESIIIVQGVCSIVTDLIGAAFPFLLLRNLKLSRRRSRLALNLLMSAGILTAVVCTIRTAFSFEVRADDQTWNGVPNALCRMLEINFGIIAACAPMMRPLWRHGHRWWKAKFGGTEATSTATKASRLQWYHPPTSTHWWTKIQRHLTWSPRPPISQTSSTQSMTNPRHQDHHQHPFPPPTHPRFDNPPMDEKSSTGRSPSQTPQPNTHTFPIRPSPKTSYSSTPRSQWAQHFERPENATWAQDSHVMDEPSWTMPPSRRQEQRRNRNKSPRSSLRHKSSNHSTLNKSSASFDLPLQGARGAKADKDDIEAANVDWGPYRYTRKGDKAAD